MPEKINPVEKFELFDDYWRHRIVGQLNDHLVKLVKVKGEFVWHRHDDQDEMFLVVKGRLGILFPGDEVWLEPGEFVIVPRGVEHMPVAPAEAHVLLIEPADTVNTGDAEDERTHEPEWL